MTIVAHSHQVFVHADQQDAFDYVSDLSRHPEWSDGELTIEAVTTDRIGVGKEYVSRGEASIQKDRRNTVRVSRYEPLHLFEFIAYDPGFGDISHVFTFSEHNGGVLVSRTMTVVLNPVLAFIFRFFIYPLVGKPSMDKSLARLKERLERVSEHTAKRASG